MYKQYVTLNVRLNDADNDRFTAYCLQSDELQFLNIFCVSEVATVRSADLLVILCWLYCTTKPIQVTEGGKYFFEGSMRPSGRMIVSPAIDEMKNR